MYEKLKEMFIGKRVSVGVADFNDKRRLYWYEGIVIDFLENENLSFVLQEKDGDTRIIQMKDIKKIKERD